MSDNVSGLRVGLLAGSLGQGGAEKQLLYIVRALLTLGADVRIYCLTSGEFYETALRSLGREPIWVGKYSSPLLRLARMTRSIARFKPHILQSTHFFMNLYALLAARPQGSLSVGSIRCDVKHGLNENGRWGKALLFGPPSLVANSYAAKRNAETLGIHSGKIHVLPNVIELGDEAERERPVDSESFFGSNRPVVAAIGSLVQAKRFDRFLVSLAQARRDLPDLAGIVVGDGPKRKGLERLAVELGLLPDGVRFLGRRNDVPAILRQVSMLALSSEHEGFPNVVLEAMAARLPVIATPVGDVTAVVQHEISGFIVALDDTEEMADRMVQLASSRELRERLGSAGRLRLEQEYVFERLPNKLLQTYHAIAKQQNNRRVLARLG